MLINISEYSGYCSFKFSLVYSNHTNKIKSPGQLGQDSSIGSPSHSQPRHVDQDRVLDQDRVKFLTLSPAHVCSGHISDLLSTSWW